MQSYVYKLFAALFGAMIAILEPTIDYVAICTLAVMMDCYTAWRLSARVKKAHPDANDGKFKSRHGRRIFGTILKIYSLIVLAYLVDTVIFPWTVLYLPNIVAAAFCFIQVWSILENESSCNGSRWAKMAQKILVNKAERHFDIDLNELKKKTETGKEDRQ